MLLLPALALVGLFMVCLLACDGQIRSGWTGGLDYTANLNYESC